MQKVLRHTNGVIQKELFFLFLKCDFQNYLYFVRRMQKNAPWHRWNDWKRVKIIVVLLIFLKCDFQNYWYFVRSMQKVLRHTNGIIQKEWKSFAFFNTFEMRISELFIFRWTYAKSEPGHRWAAEPGYEIPP